MAAQPGDNPLGGPPDPGAAPSRAAGGGPDGYDRLRRRVLWAMPSGLYLLGSAFEGRTNLMTLNWATQVAVQPKLLGVGVERAALTHELVQAGGVFSLSILRRADRVLVRHFVKPASADAAAGTLGGEAVTTAVTGAPILVAAAAWLDCRVRHQLDCGSHSFFVGEVVDCAFPGEVEPGGAPLEVLRMEDTRMSYGG